MSPPRIKRYKFTPFWAVYSSTGRLICVCVYKKGAQAVVKELLGRDFIVASLLGHHRAEN